MHPFQGGGKVAHLHDSLVSHVKHELGLGCSAGERIGIRAVIVNAKLGQFWQQMDELYRLRS
jgi:hypothetical protein